ncbi:MAG: error-prone DNA polymerase [Actinomycetaceae bacterium]|nr:error-prone DNA polymerase [Actinomycetaceae bacterium]
MARPSRIPYVELHVHSAYSFLDGASLPKDLVARACELELDGLALTDHNGFPGIVQLAEAARRTGLPIAVGTELTLDSTQRTGHPDPEGEHVLVLAGDAGGYRRLSHAVGQAMLDSGKKAEAHYRIENLAQASGGSWMVLTGCRKGSVRRALEKSGHWDVDAAIREVDALVSLFGRDNVAVELTNSGAPLDRERCSALVEVAERTGVAYLATGNVHYARAGDRRVADVLAATRARTSLDEIDPYLPANGAYLRSGAQMLQLHRDHPRAVATAASIGAQCAFDLALVRPNLPDFPVPEGHTEASWLRALTHERSLERYGSRSENPRAWQAIDHELDVITALGFSGYFLIVEEIVSFCASRGIWCQGRGSAANSAVCFALGITAVDAVRHRMLFERFLSPGRSGSPDIDLDIESQRREEVIQHVYERYGRHCAAQVANAITYRPRSAIRDAARALGYEPGLVDRWAKTVERGAYGPLPSRAEPGDNGRPLPEVFSEVPHQVAEVAARLQRLPRHLGIHPGGMVLCDRPVIDVCPVSWASMPGRTVLQWDKDDCAEAGLVKFDLLGLGMLTALRISFDQLNEHGETGVDGRSLSLHNLPQDDRRIYTLLQEADTVGVFQVESRAQMATLPRLRPDCFYDIVIDVALIRPGPIQGDAVNPYINRRRGREAVTYPHPLTKPALEKTLGVPLFQEQLMQIAIDVAGFTPAQADRLRKAMGAKRSHERMAELKTELLEGMRANGVDSETCEQLYDKLNAFADFGFPESHAFSFAYLVYASAWLKVHHPEHFYAGIIAAQPMGFYSPQSLVADARRHGVVVAPPDVVRSRDTAHVRHADQPNSPQVKAAKEYARKDVAKLVDAHSWLEVRLGLESVRGLGTTARARILSARQRAPFADVADLARRARLSRRHIEALAAAGALESLGMERREGIWMARALEDGTAYYEECLQPAIPGTEATGTMPNLPAMSHVESSVTDLASTGVSTTSHPVQHARQMLDERGVSRIADLLEAPDRTRLSVAGIVTHRQHPPTAGNRTFISLEDETGLLNVVCSQGLWSRYRDIARNHQSLVIRGMVERGDGAINLVADRIDPLPLPVVLPSRDFR